jgi:hypothetical protein
MKTNQKGSMTTILLIIILIVVSVGGYMYVQKNKIIPENKTVPVVSEGESVLSVQFEDGLTN